MAEVSLRVNQGSLGIVLGILELEGYSGPQSDLKAFMAQPHQLFFF